MAIGQNIVFLGLGSNQGDRRQYLDQAISELKKLGTVLKVSSVRETKAWGKTDQPDFLNAALKMETELEPLKFLREIQAIETRLGRVRKEKWGPRTIDIDILLWNDETINYPNLKVPHPLMKERAFVLTSLTELLDEMDDF